MGGWTVRTERHVRRHVVMVLAAGFCVLVPAPGVAFAQSGGTAISAGYDHTCALEGGSAYCWGNNTRGALGDGTTGSSDVPVAVDASGVLAGKSLTQMAIGDQLTCVLDSAGAAYCWGFNVAGELGDGTTSNSDVPVAVDTSGVLAGKTLVQITAGNDQACALDSAGAAYCWGNNASGQLGDGTTSSSDVPVAVDTSGVLAGVTLTQVTTGGFHTCALDSGGAAYCWGSDEWGELGVGSTSDDPQTAPVTVAFTVDGKTLAQITAGASHTCALDSGGTAYCWGSNASGEVGDGTSNLLITTPEPVDDHGVLAGRTRCPDHRRVPVHLRDGRCR
jgi:alpha-tubulin suppressor-like RCC1 family protein